MDNISCLVLTDKEPKEVTQEELKEVLMNQDGDLERLEDFKPEGTRLVWGYLCKVYDYFSSYIMDMDKVILLIDDDDYACGYEFAETDAIRKDELKVIGLMDENAEIEPTERIR